MEIMTTQASLASSRTWLTFRYAVIASESGAASASYTREVNRVKKRTDIGVPVVGARPVV